MLLRRISLAGVRSHELKSIDLDPRVTLILGPNGSGKTTVLEAVYATMRGRSFRGALRDIIPFEGENAEIKLELENDHTRRLTISTAGDELAKKFIVGESGYSRMRNDHRLPVVLFEPDELRLLTSSPQRRRDFIDGIISRLSDTYAAVLSRHQRALLQRNVLLKQRESMSESEWQNHLFVWDVKYAELSASIIRARSNFIAHSNTKLSSIYSKIAESDHELEARYITPFTDMGDGLQQALLYRLEAARDNDAMKGNTSVGPHRDDLELFLDSHPASESASRGEMRTIMLAFKLLEVELQEHHSGTKPLILLDDVFSELDSNREQALIRALGEHQTIITATDLRDELLSHSLVISLK